MISGTSGNARLITRRNCYHLFLQYPWGKVRLPVLNKMISEFETLRQARALVATFDRSQGEIAIRCSSSILGEKSGW
ncbi:hypothetical protein PoB_003834200 [Plakobranchus ocellatus]|uniref:Uncharacterized protein n=1 Tax=Plakobranchus ocellatus TaxID=259542 RepID=A0AAV4AY43_9GAST|nr:hypothetical protein PoB_003834200 [Plakobranchus ocellatus]